MKNYNSNKIFMSKFKKKSQKNDLDFILTSIIQIFNEAINKFQLAIIVPLLIENSMLQSLLTKEEMELINNIILFTDKNHQSYSSLSRISNISDESSTSGLYEDGNITDDMVFKMLKILYSYSSIRAAAPSYQMNISTQSSLFKNYIYYFMDYAISLMQLMPNEEMTKTLHYRNIWFRHKNALTKIRKLSANLEMQREDKEKTTESTMIQYKNDTMIIDRLNRMCLEDIQSIGNNYEKKQYLFYKSWELKRDKLHDQLDQIKKELETIKTTDFKTIANINSRRMKTEAQLLSLINKFDVDMDEKLSEYEELCKTYESDEMEKNDLKVAIKLQEDTYNLFLKNVFDETSEYYTG